MSPEPHNTGPSAVHIMLTKRTFASEVMAKHGTEDAVLDEGELGLLREFCGDPGGK